MMKWPGLVLACIVLPGGCYRTTVEPGWQPLAGEQHFTRRGFEFYWLHGTARYPTVEAAAQAIDDAYVTWNAWFTAAYPSTRPPFELLIQLQREVIQLMPWNQIPGNDRESFEVGIWWWNHHQIDIAMKGPNHPDEDTGFWLSGIDVLIHEWTHVILGGFHPQKGTPFCPCDPVEETPQP